jgi:molybdopterin-binding protein
MNTLANTRAQPPRAPGGRSLLDQAARCRLALFLGDGMRLSARNVLKGRVVEVLLGSTVARVKIIIEGGAIITSSITVEAAQDLNLKAGDEATAIIKASDVIVGKE